MSYLSQFPLAPFVQHYGIQNFVETGCLGGGGMKAAMDAGIGKIFSCDIVKGCADACQRAFPKAVVMNLDGSAFLERIIPHLVGPCLFWLDAHFPMQDTTVRIPIAEELGIVALKTDVRRDIILVDDLAQIRSPLSRLPVASPHAQDVDLSVITLFGQTHQRVWWEGQTGILMLLPKQV